MTFSRPVLAACALLLVTAVPAAAFRPDQALRIATGVAAQSLCSQTFVSGLNPETTFRETVAPTLGHGWLMKPLAYRVDREQREAQASWAGGFASRAVYRGEAGCLLWRGEGPPPPMPSLAPIATTRAPLAGNAPVAGPPRLAAALEQAFAEPAASGVRRNVKAIVALQDGRLVAERYAPGIGVATPLPGYSLTKTATASLVGRLVAQGKLRLDAPTPVAAWAHDARAAITLEHLLRMESGLAAAETHSGFDFNSKMLFLAPDMAAYAEGARLAHEPGTAWAYQSANSHIAAGIVKAQVGGRETDVLDFARRELFGPLGMTTAVFETDAVGTPVGGSGLYASARDWARLGQLYLDDGVAGGVRLLPAGWAAWAARPTLNTPYGGGLWTNGSSDPGRQASITRAGLPPEAFYASGRLGQRIYVVPSRRLVVVRLGVTQEPGGDLPGDMAMLAAVMAALP